MAKRHLSIGEPVRPLHLWVVGGQSNAAGVITNPAGFPVPQRGYEYVAATRTFTSLDEPLAGQTEGNCGPWSAFANKYNELRPNATPVLLQRARGGSAQLIESQSAPDHNWDVDGASGAHYKTSVPAIHNCLADLDARSEPYEFKGILWDQGGREGIAMDDDSKAPGFTAANGKALYKAHLEAMIAAFRSEFGASLAFCISRLGRHRDVDSANWTQIRDAQEEVAAADPFTHIVWDRAYFFPGESKMSDTFHYTTAGYIEMGEGCAVGVVGADL